ALADLRWLNLNSNQIGSALEDLADSPYLAQMRVLLLQFAGIPDESVLTLAEAPTVRNLWHLNLNANRLTGLAARALIDSPHLDKLVRLELARNDIGVQEQSALRERFGPGISV